MSSSVMATEAATAEKQAAEKTEVSELELRHIPWKPGLKEV
jgi:hypothetical protein